MNHTPESLLALTKSPEGLEQLRIIAAEFDGFKWSAWNPVMGGNGCCYLDREGIFTEEEIELPRCENFDDDIPNYPTSLDAIFAAEERLGLHDRNNHELLGSWYAFTKALMIAIYGSVYHQSDITFLPPRLRLIPFILTAQWKEQNQ